MVSKFFSAKATAGFRAHPFAAIGYILVSTTAFSAMNVSVRVIAGEFNPTLIVMLRCLVTLALLAPWVLRAGVGHTLKTTRLSGHAARGIVGGIGMIGWTYSVSILPVTHATALSFTAPLFVTLLAILFLGEKAGLSRWLALMAGFIGTLIILRPDAQSFDARSLIVLATSVFWATTGILIKSLSATEPPLRMVVYMNIFMFLLSAPFGLMHWAWPTPHVWAMLVVIGACSLVMHLSMVRAYSLAPLVALMPFDFTRLISTAIFAYLLFGETSDWHTWLGAAIIIASALATARISARPAAVE